MKTLIRNIQLSIISIIIAAPLNAFAQDEERIVLITGANRGIGLEFTEQYLQRLANLKRRKILTNCKNNILGNSQFINLM